MKERNNSMKRNMKKSSKLLLLLMCLLMAQADSIMGGVSRGDFFHISEVRGECVEDSECGGGELYRDAHVYHGASELPHGALEGEQCTDGSSEISGGRTAGRSECRRLV